MCKIHACEVAPRPRSLCMRHSGPGGHPLPADRSPEPPSERPGKREVSGAAAADASGAAGTDAAVGTSLSDSNREVAAVRATTAPELYTL